MIFRPNDRRPARCALLGYTLAVVKCLSARRSTIPGWRWPACCWSGPSSATPRSPSSTVSAIASLCIGQEACCTTQVLTPKRKERQDDDSLRALRLCVRSSHDSMSLAGTEISSMSSPPTAPTSAAQTAGHRRLQSSGRHVAVHRAGHRGRNPGPCSGRSKLRGAVWPSF